jgi:quinohemoprotein ethanol dehydrogenase
MRAMLAALALAVGLSACGPGVGGPAAVDEARIVNADREAGSWLSYGRTYSEQRYSPLTRVNTQNVSQLGLAWSYEMREGRVAEATPIVVDGVMYVTSAWSIVYALNAATGEELWVFDPEVPRERGQYACCDVGNRGVAVWKGKIYVATIDGRLIAIDARTGAKKWETLTVDLAKPYTITGAPRAARGLIFIGNGGAEYGVRGYVSAYDAETGELKWRFYTTPNPTEADGAASDSVRDMALATWNRNAGAWLESGGGGTAWDSLVYDNETDTLWIGTGNGAPWNRQIRSPDSADTPNNDNLFLASIVAVDPDTGAYKCHYQTTPGETWDFTATQQIMLATLAINGQERKVAMQAPKNGYFYVIDRTDCSLISAAPIVPQTWTTGIDSATGRPVEAEGARFHAGTALITPSALGAHNWHPMAMSQQTGLVYIPAQEVPLDYTTDSAFVYRPGRWNTGTVHASLPPDRAARAAVRNSVKGFLLAWDPVNQKEVWRAPLAGPWNGGAMATAGGLVFQGSVDGKFAAYDAATGAKLWEFNNHAATQAGPMTYEIGGQQYVASLAGYGGAFFLSAGFAAPQEGNALKSRVNVFRLGATATLPTPDLERLETPEPPAIRANAATLTRGANTYQQFCGVCHGLSAISGGVLPDLRRSPLLQDPQSWTQTVHGARKDLGMPDFTQWVSAADAEAVRAFVAGEARLLYDAEHRAGQ